MLAYRLEDDKIVELLEYGSEEQLEQFPNFIATDREIIQNRQGQFVFKDELSESELYELQYGTLEEIKANKIAQLKSARDTEEQSPILYNQYYWDFDDKAIQRINGAIIALSNGGTITWTSAENEEINEVTADDLRGVISASAVRSNALHIKYRQLREQVEQATTLEEVESIVW